MTKIYIVRHGETDWNCEGRLQGGTNTSLNQRGKQQAMACQYYFENEKCDAIYSSSLDRASQTASIMNQTLQLPFHCLKEFSERTFGVAEGMTPEERAKAYPDKKYPNQESVEDLKKRILSGLQIIQHQYPKGKVILVTHGAVIHTLFSIIEKSDDSIGDELLSNGGVSEISRQDGKWWLEKYNETKHLINV